MQEGDFLLQQLLGGHGYVSLCIIELGLIFSSGHEEICRYAVTHRIA